MSIKPVLVPDHDAVSLRKLMDHFATALTGPSRQQLTESRSAVAAARKKLSEGSEQQLNIQQLATISDEALDNAYHYGRSTPGNTFGWQANLKSAAYAKQMIDQGVTDIEAISDAIHKGWNVTARAFVQNPEQFADTEKLRTAGKLEAKLQQRAKLMNIGYSQLPDDEQEKDRVVARALLQALKGSQGVAEGKRADRYHIVKKDGKPATLASYADRASAVKDRDEKYPGATVQKVGPRGKVKDVTESLNEFLAPDGSNYGGDGGGDDEPRQYRVIITLYDDSAHEDETAERRIGITVTATSEQAACDQAETMLLKSDRYDGSRITNVTARPVLDEQNMSRAAKGYEKYGREGMQALARAGREGRALDPVRDRYDRYDEAVAEGQAGKELKAIDGDYYEDSTDFFSRFDQDHFDREEESADGMEIRGYIDDVCVMVFKFSTPDMMGGWGNYDDSALIAEAGRGFRGVGGARDREDDERHDLDPSDWYIVKDGKLLKASIYPNQHDQARAEGFSPTREQARARAANNDLDETTGVKYGVFAKGGSVGSQRFRDDPLKTFDTREEAVRDARRRRSGLSKGDRGYYGMGYVVRPIRGEVDEDWKQIAGAGALAAATALGGYAAGSNNSSKGFSNTKGIDQFNKPTAAHVQPLKTQADLDRYNKTRPPGESKLLNLPGDFEEGVTEDDVDDFVARGGKITQVKPNKGPRRSGVSLGSKHIGTVRGGKASSISGKRANTRPTIKPVVAVEQQVDEKSEAVRHGNNSRSIYHVDESVDPIEQLRADIRRFAQ